MCKLLGMTSRQAVLRRPVFSIFPAGIAAAVQRDVNRYLACGEGFLVDYSRTVLTQDAAGALKPVVLSIRDSPSDDLQGMLQWALRPLPSSRVHLLWLTTEGDVRACSAGAADMLGCETAGVEELRWSAGGLVAEWGCAEIQADLRSAHGCVVRLTIPNPAADTGSSPPAAADAGVWVHAKLSDFRIGRVTAGSLLQYMIVPHTDGFRIAKADQRRTALLGVPSLLTVRTSAALGGSFTNRGAPAGAGADGVALSLPPPLAWTTPSRGLLTPMSVEAATARATSRRQPRLASLAVAADAAAEPHAANEAARGGAGLSDRKSVV